VRTASSVARTIAGAYGIEYAQALADVREILGQLRDAELVVGG
jgi:hypothetical protein